MLAKKTLIYCISKLNITKVVVVVVIVVVVMVVVDIQICDYIGLQDINTNSK